MALFRIRKKMQSFWKLSNNYCSFIVKYAAQTKHLIELTRSTNFLKWNEESWAAFGFFRWIHFWSCCGFGGLRNEILWTTRSQDTGPTCCIKSSVLLSLRSEKRRGWWWLPRSNYLWMTFRWIGATVSPHSNNQRITFLKNCYRCQNDMTGTNTTNNKKLSQVSTSSVRSTSEDFFERRSHWWVHHSLPAEERQHKSSKVHLKHVWALESWIRLSGQRPDQKTLSYFAFVP